MAGAMTLGQGDDPQGYGMPGRQAGWRRSTELQAADLGGAVEWASRARGALLLERSALARERDEIVREATELLAGVLGDPLTASGAAGVRERLARALGEPSS